MTKKRVSKSAVEKEKTAPRPYTVEEMRTMFLKHLQGLCDYWITTPLNNIDRVKEQGELRYRMEGFLFSTLVLFDGGSGMMPAFDITPSPHDTDEDYHRESGENWWTKEVINGASLHEIYSERDRTGK